MSETSRSPLRKILVFAVVEVGTGLVLMIYNALIALYLAYLGTAGHRGGLLLWPGVALHAVVALCLVWTWRSKA